LHPIPRQQGVKVVGFGLSGDDAFQHVGQINFAVWISVIAMARCEAPLLLAANSSGTSGRRSETGVKRSQVRRYSRGTTPCIRIPVTGLFSIWASRKTFIGRSTQCKASIGCRPADPA
jgi:hypothetical protein